MAVSVPRVLSITDVIMELVDNSLDAVPKQSDPSLKVEILADLQKLTLTVKDNGPGIPIPVLTELQSAYQRVAGVAKPAPKDSGVWGWKYIGTSCEITTRCVLDSSGASLVLFANGVSHLKQFLMSDLLGTQLRICDVSLTTISAIDTDSLAEYFDSCIEVMAKEGIACAIEYIRITPDGKELSMLYKTTEDLNL